MRGCSPRGTTDTDTGTSSPRLCSDDGLTVESHSRSIKGSEAGEFGTTASQQCDPALKPADYSLHGFAHAASQNTIARYVSTYYSSLQRPRSPTAPDPATCKTALHSLIGESVLGRTSGREGRTVGNFENVGMLCAVREGVRCMCVRWGGPVRVCGYGACWVEV
ncbi:hypothetical protein CC86DRAFT_82369 [Ophiobolus disseminans]|uniref:Uncharacterized protein n=1 Tax=Ophiobolus disseminans TaxID=1469910 RepID=A0A6A7AEW9_9PLEO|nr:hypothetical protein CC86DRAFT_82369 [Ophiobolus disseminans]